MTQLTTVGLRDTTLPSSALQVIQWAAATGTVDAITATYVDTVTVLEDGLCLCFRATGANTSTTPTFSPDGLTAGTITKRGGAALRAGDIPAASAEIIVRYNLANTRWEMLAFDNPNIPWVAAGGTVSAITATYSPAIVTLTDGLLVGFRAVGANTSTAPTFAPNGLTARAITKRGGSALAVGDIPAANAEVTLRYNLANTRWELLNPATSGDTLWRVLSADDTGGTNVNTAQPWFPSSGGVTVAASTTYRFEGMLYTTRSAGTTSHTTGVQFGGTCTLTDIGFFAWCKSGDANDLQTISGFWSAGCGYTDRGQGRLD
jgi:hypothetical protein